MTGYILSSFFYGYIVTQFPGGWLATRFGTKHIFGGGMFISIVATFLTPLAARSHPYLLIALRVLIGLAHVSSFSGTLWRHVMIKHDALTFQTDLQNIIFKSSILGEYFLKTIEMTSL